MIVKSVHFYAAFYLSPFCFDWCGLTYYIKPHTIECKVYSCGYELFSLCIWVEEKRRSAEK